MVKRLYAHVREMPGRLNAFLSDPICCALLPALCLAAFWAGGQTALICLSIAMPCLYLLVGASRSRIARGFLDSTLSGSMTVDAFKAQADRYFNTAREQGTKTAMFMLQVDGHEELIRRSGKDISEKIASEMQRRLTSVLRAQDAICQTDRLQFSICLAPVQNVDLDVCLGLAARMSAACEAPMVIDGVTVHLTASVGFSQKTNLSVTDSKSWQEEAVCALREASLNGPAATRAFSKEMRRRSQVRSELRDDVAKALEDGQIVPWFQPQVSTDTGLVSGFEALARWNHPNRGMIPPSVFLPAIEKVGLLEPLAELMMHEAFAALKVWESAGIWVPQVGVNFAGPELSNPKLAEKVMWHLDCFDLAPNRLAVEVLETVVASSADDVITRNIRRLSEMGCAIDLDDFGTGQASIASIRRFAVSRIKIDRSFVIKADRDQEQQRMISAILTMAERLDVETLAEGVETAGEHALLAQLGCNHVQGFGIGKPMPLEQTFGWIAEHNEKLAATPKIIGNGSH